jgi:hypothetical protein
MIFKIKNPPYKKIVVFDGKSLNDLEYVLDKEDFITVENRKNRIKVVYCGFSFLIKCFLNYIFLFSKNKNMHTVYLYTLIKSIQPNIVITSVDNSYTFSTLALLLSKKIKFIAIQNANRFDYLHNDYFFKKKITNKNLNKKYFIPHFYCFGQHEIDECMKYDIKIKKFQKIGSIRVANFFEYVKNNKILLDKNKYDICLISEPAPNIDKKFNVHGLEENFAKVAKLAIQYAKKYKKKFVFLQKKPFKSFSNKIEIDFYKKYLKNDEFNFLINHSNTNSGPYPSYFGLFQSKIAIGAQSTLLRDKLGCEEKILSLNISDESLFKFPINGACYLENLEFSKFEKKLNDINLMSINEYLMKLGRSSDYVMKFDNNSNVIEKIKNDLC